MVAAAVDGWVRGAGACVPQEEEEGEEGRRPGRGGAGAGAAAGGPEDDEEEEVADGHELRQIQLTRSQLEAMWDKPFFEGEQSAPCDARGRGSWPGTPIHGAGALALVACRDGAAGEGLTGALVRMAYGPSTTDKDGRTVPTYWMMQVRARCARCARCAW